jgi:hypothetical protein
VCIFDESFDISVVIDRTSVNAIVVVNRWIRQDAMLSEVPVNG